MTLTSYRNRSARPGWARQLTWLAALALSSAFAAAPGQAQDGAFDMGGLTATLSIDHVTQAERARSINDQVFGQQAAGPQAPARDLTYRYSPQRTRQNLRNFVARTANPAARAELERMFAAQPTLMDDIRAGIRPYGLDSHNVVDAYAMWWMNVWLVANQRDEDPDARTVGAVKQQVRSAFAVTPAFADTGDAERQEYAEALLVQAAILGAAFEQSQNDPQMREALAEAARKGAKASGLDLSQMTLTENGFVPRKAR